MSARATDSPRLRQIDAQHHDLRAILVQVGQTQDLRRLDGLLRHLRAELADHFALEEGPDGLADVVAESAPHRLRRLAALMGEHRLFLVAVDELIERVHGLLDGAVADLVHEVETLTRQLHRHEVAETSLLTDAVFEDLGGG